MDRVEQETVTQKMKTFSFRDDDVDCINEDSKIIPCKVNFSQIGLAK